MKELLDVSYRVDQDICKLDLYLPDCKTYPVIVFFHGGGLTGGNRKRPCEIEAARAYVEKGIGYAMVEYRMYSHGAKYPDFLEDAEAAVRFVASFMKEQGNEGPILFAGSSAGAWIGLMLCLSGRYLQDLPIAGWLIESPQTTSHFTVIQQELGLDPRLERIDEYAPLYYVGPGTQFSKMLLTFYDNDMPCRYEENMLFVKHIQRFNPDADLEYYVLPGTHTQGSAEKDEDGQYPIFKLTMDWMKRKGLI